MNIFFTVKIFTVKEIFTNKISEFYGKKRREEKEKTNV